MIPRLKKALLVLRCVTYRLLHGVARSIPSAPRKVLVVQTGKLGDMVCTTPVFTAIKKQYPDCEVIVAGNKVNALVLAGHPAVDRYIIFSKHGMGAFIEEICRIAPDVALLTTPDTPALAALYLAGIKGIVAPRIENGISPNETRSYRMIRSWVISAPHRMQHYAPGEYLALLKPLGIHTTDTTKTLAYSQEAKEKIVAWIGKEGLSGTALKVGIAPAAGNRIKMWPHERFAPVAEHLINTYGASIIIIGGPNEHEDAKKMKAALHSDTHVIDTTGALSIDELKALMPHLQLFISVDTGPIYIAEASGVATIDITGPIDEREQPPIGPRHLVVVPPQRHRPQLYVMNARTYDFAEARRQAESITVAMVNEAVDQLLKYEAHRNN